MFSFGLFRPTLSYYIEGFSMPFHDLPELFEFIVNSGKFVIMFQGLTVYLGNFPLFWIRLKFPPDGRIVITYVDYPKIEQSS